MLPWGAAWGAILGLLWSGGSSDFRVIVGAVLGWAAAWTLRAALRKEFASRAAQPVPAPTPAMSVRVPAADAVPQLPPQPQAQRSEAVPVRQREPVPTVSAAPASVILPAPSSSKPLPEPVHPEPPSALEILFARARDWLLGGNTVLRVGLLVLFIGLALLARYAVENALLPPELRLAAVAAAGIALFVLGDRAGLWHTAWATVILLAAASVALLALVFACTPALRAPSRRWPLDRFAPDYAWRAAAPIALALAVGALLVAVSSAGETRPLPYVPVVNPTDLAVALALASCALWLLRVRLGPLELPRVMQQGAPVAVLVAIAFVAINTVWLRVAHHYADVPWDAHAMYASFLVQAGYSILWTAIALVLMVAAHRGRHRTPWMMGAGLLAPTVLKLFLVDLSNRGGAERIVVFIAVGVLMLLVGWFAPLPPAPERDAGLGSAA